MMKYVEIPKKTHILHTSGDTMCREAVAISVLLQTTLEDAKLPPVPCVVNGWTI